MARRRQPGARRYPRTARLNEVLREILAEEIERIDDERLGFFTVTSVEVDASLEHSKLKWTAIGVSDEEVLAVLEEHRPRLQRVVNAQTHIRRTPIIHFEADIGQRSLERVEEILRGLDTSPHPHDVAASDDSTSDDSADDAQPDDEIAPEDDAGSGES